MTKLFAIVAEDGRTLQLPMTDESIVVVGAGRVDEFLFFELGRFRRADHGLFEKTVENTVEGVGRL